MSSPKSAATILIDRAWHHQLVLSEPRTLAIKQILEPYELVAFETGGASALHRKLGEVEWLRDRLCPVGRDTLKRLAAIDTQVVSTHIDALILNGKMMQAYRKYVAMAGRLADPEERFVSYLYRLVAISYAMDADIFLAESRIGGFNALLEYHGVQCEHFEDSSANGGIAARSISFLPKPSSLSPHFRYLTLASEKTSPSSEGLKGAQNMSTGHTFISYSHENKDQVRILRDTLVSAGEKVWWDQDILPGQDWNYEIRQALRTAAVFVICLSVEAEARSKSGIYPEALDAIRMYRERKPGTIFIIPVRLSLSSVPQIQIDATRTLDSIQYIDLFPASTWSANIARLVSAIKSAKADP